MIVRRTLYRCSHCGRAVPADQVSEGMGAGMLTCAVCRANAIHSLSNAQPIFSLVVQWMNGQGLMYEGAAVRLGIYSWPDLVAHAGKSLMPGTLGTTHVQIVRSGRTTTSRDINVAVLKGLPSTHFQGVAVHEMAHAWLAIHDIIAMPSWASEGFCEFLTYRYYVTVPSQESKVYAQRMEANPDPDYGGGMRRVRDIVASRGWLAVRDALLATKQMPSV